MKKKRRETVWLTCEELGQLEGQHATSIRWRVRNGKYKSARKVQRFGDAIRGRQWFISLYDTQVSSRAREKYFLQKMVREILATEIKNLHERIRRHQIMRMTIKGFLRNLIDGLYE